MLVKTLLFKISPKLLASIEYYHVFKRRLRWNKPLDINEKINWLKFNSDTSLWSVLADKYRVRDYIENKGLGDMLVKLYGKWDSANEIDWDSLPDRFVMKVNNGSGDILVCRDKSMLNQQKVLCDFEGLLKKRFNNQNSEPHYQSMPPCIIAEELLDCTKQPIETSSLIDYKIWCFNGKPHHVWVCYNRTPTSVEVGTYDLDWNYHPECSVFTSHYRESKYRIPKPESLQKMLEAAAILSEGIPQVRVDLYEVGGKPYFGEMTFTSAGGFMDFYTDEFLEEMGSHVELPTK